MYARMIGIAIHWEHGLPADAGVALGAHRGQVGVMVELGLHQAGGEPVGH